MAGSSESYHEPYDLLSSRIKNYHRALTSLEEELEAVDWYRQRAEATDDAELREILLHNMREEMEHAAMLMEWLRRNDSDFDERMRTYLFTTQPITAIEEEAEAGGATGAADDGGGGDSGTALPSAVLTVGKLKRE